MAWGHQGEQLQNNNKAHVVGLSQGESTSQELESLNKEEIKRVRSLISNLEKPLGTCFFGIFR